MNWTEIKRVKESLRRVDGYQRLRGRESEADSALTTKAVPCCLRSETHAQGRRHQPALTWTRPNSWRLKGVGRREQLDRQSSVSRAWGNPSLPPPHHPSITPSPSNHAPYIPPCPERSRQHTALRLYQPTCIYIIKLLTHNHQQVKSKLSPVQQNSFLALWSCNYAINN